MIKNNNTQNEEIEYQKVDRHRIIDKESRMDCGYLEYRKTEIGWRYESNIEGREPFVSEMKPEDFVDAFNKTDKILEIRLL